MGHTKRILFLDAIKTLSILFVIWGHALRFDTILESGTALYTFIYSFHMPLFMIISGYFSISSFGRSFEKVICLKIKQLIIPIVFWTILTCIYMYVMHYSKHKIIEEIIGNNWFLKTLFVCYVYSWIAKKIIPYNNFIVFLISWIILLTIPQSSFLQINWLYIFFWIGIMIRSNIEIIKKTSNSILIVCCLLLPFFYIIKIANDYNNYIPLNISTFINLFPIHFVRFSIALSMSILIFVLIYIIYEHCTTSKLLSFIAKCGQYTLGIYVLQSFILERVLTDFLVINHNNTIFFQYILTPIISLILLLLCVFLIKIFSKSKYIDIFFFGGQYYKKQQ